jgi:ubiquinone/menaquinone biosynthesis C-methylase UbiE
MLVLHEMGHSTRIDVLAEMKRVLKENGRILLIDFHPGPIQPFQGWLTKLVILWLARAYRSEFIGDRKREGCQRRCVGPIPIGQGLKR